MSAAAWLESIKKLGRHVESAKYRGTPLSGAMLCATLSA